MKFDMPTLVAMESFVGGCAGAILLVAWALNKRMPALALWGIGNIVAAAGLFLLLEGSAFGLLFGSIISGSLLTLGRSFMWMGTCWLAAKPARLGVALLGPAVVLLAELAPILRNFAGPFHLAAGAVYLYAAAYILWFRVAAQLWPRWPLVALTSTHATALSIGAYSTFNGFAGPHVVAPIISMWVVHFEGAFFMLGTAVFVLAYVKEGDEVATALAARTDSLTGIFNRGAFMENAKQVMERCAHNGAPVSMIMFDLDRFKAVNDRHGHAIGDAVIRKFCDIVAALLRPGDVFGRIGGEEFAVALPGSSIEAARACAEQIRNSFAENCRFLGSRQIDATVSGGLAMSANGEQTLNALLDQSDAALYRAKADGRNRIRCAEPPEAESKRPTTPTPHAA